MKLQGKRGQALTVQSLMPLSIALVVFVIVVGLGGTILAEISEGQCDSVNATSKTCLSGDSKVGYNITQDGLLGVDQLGSWTETIAIVIAAAVIIGIITAFFVVRKQ
jgi:hypothetical protein